MLALQKWVLIILSSAWLAKYNDVARTTRVLNENYAELKAAAVHEMHQKGIKYKDISVHPVLLREPLGQTDPQTQMKTV